jgi:hypothetical protein
MSHYDKVAKGVTLESFGYKSKVLYCEFAHYEGYLVL